jgi:hypothetical protein
MASSDGPSPDFRVRCRLLFSLGHLVRRTRARWRCLLPWVKTSVFVRNWGWTRRRELIECPNIFRQNELRAAGSARILPGQSVRGDVIAAACCFYDLATPADMRRTGRSKGRSRDQSRPVARDV